MAPGAWKWLASVGLAARRGLGLLPGVPGPEVVAAVGVSAAAARLWCGLPSATGWGVAV